jgi:Uncharacterized protein conserved in bacteria
MALDVMLIVLGVLFTIIGVLGCVLPVLPGSFMNYFAILLLHFTSRIEFSTYFLLTWALIVVLVQVFSFYIQIWGTKQFGGGKGGMKGSTIGIILGLFIFPPWGVILFPFIGAVLGELGDNKDFNSALKAGTGAFLGFIGGVVANLIVAVALSFHFFKAAIGYFF